MIANRGAKRRTISERKFDTKKNRNVNYDKPNYKWNICVYFGALTKPGTWNIPEHPGTFRNIPEHPGTGQIITK